MKQENKYIKTASYEADPNDVNKVVLLYSGGLDTSVMVKWIAENYNAEVVALCIDIGQLLDDTEKIRKKALKLGAVKSIVYDAKQEFAENYIAQGIRANASYQGEYHLSCPLGRPVLAKVAVKIAEQEGADAVAHGCTGKGNDQVRLDGYITTLNPDLKVIAPVREWGMGRDEEIVYARKHKIPVTQTKAKPYSYDDNMWGSTAEGGEIENPELIPPLSRILQVCRIPSRAPNKAAVVKIEFVKGIPVAVNGKADNLVNIINKLNKLGAIHGVGVCHLIEDRVVGLKVRGIYEAPAAHVIISAHRDLEKMMCTRRENKFKHIVDLEWAYLVYGALWFEPLMRDLNAFIDKVNEKVNGVVTLRLHKGKCTVKAVKAPDALFEEKMATFMKSETFNQNASPGFIELWSLQMRMAKRTRKNILITIGKNEHKKRLLPAIEKLAKLHVRLHATEGTAKFLAKNNLKVHTVYKMSQRKNPNIEKYIDQKRFDMIINIPNRQKKKTITDGHDIRKKALEKKIHLITSIEVAEDMIEKLFRKNK